MVQVDDVRVVGIVKKRPAEQYYLIFDEARRGDAVRRIAQWAADPELTFTWSDAALLATRIRGHSKESA